MRKKYWWPTILLERRAWILNFKAKFAFYALSFGYDQDDIDKNNAECDWLIWCIDVITAAEDRYHQLIALKDLIFGGDETQDVVSGGFVNVPNPLIVIKQGAFTRVREKVNAIKANKDVYTTSIGQAMEIIGADIDFNPEQTTAVISRIQVYHDRVSLSFKKMLFNGMAVYCKRGNGAYEKIGVYSFSPVEDKRLNLTAEPEDRTYKIIGIFKDEEAGFFSSEWKVTVDVH